MIHIAVKFAVRHIDRRTVNTAIGRPRNWKKDPDERAGETLNPVDYIGIGARATIPILPSRLTPTELARDGRPR
jgi:hypothetical protein